LNVEEKLLTRKIDWKSFRLTFHNGERSKNLQEKMTPLIIGFIVREEICIL
jgi:hypothetical protein